MTTVEEGFRDFLRGLTRSESETAIAARHRSTINTCLKQKFGMTTFFRTGSFGFGTSIFKFSDVDYFAEIPNCRCPSDSSIALRKVKEVLSTRFPNTTVRVRTPAVAIFFGGGERVTEIVPALFHSKVSNGGYRTYQIPDGNGDWLNSSPEQHKVWINQLDSNLSFKLKPLIRFVKAWNYFLDVGLRSFYLELRVAKYASKRRQIVYSTDMHSFLKELWSCKLVAIRDPMGISGLVQPCSTLNQWRNAISKLNSAKKRSENAFAFEEKGDIPSAFYWWNMLYGKCFSSYY